jgi:peptidoglycan/LPS O-acetylase OafA/YrhL
MQIRNFTKDNTLIYKGIGILLILFHNLFHWMLLDSCENEWDFKKERIINFYDALVQYPFDFINVLLSYFGHFGVQIFIFISGVGLALSMQNKSRGWGIFMIERLKKLYPLLIVCFVFFFFYQIYFDWKMLEWYHYKEFFYKFVFIHILIPESDTSLSGPWWFFGLIFQLYLLFPLLFKAIKKYNVKAFIVICLISYIWIYISQYVYAPEANIMLLQNAPGHLPEFALGILLALNPEKKIHFSWVVLSLVIFSLGNFYKLFFPLTFLSITVLLYWGITKIIPFILNKTKKIKNVLFFYGSISMVLFAIHGPLRRQCNAISGDTFWMRYFSAILFLIAATGLAILGNMLYKWMVEKLSIKKTNLQ